MQGDKEYDGFVINAPDIAVAWQLFCGIDGKYKLPNPDDYTCEKIGLAYFFTSEHIDILRGKWGYSNDIDLDCLHEMRLAWLDAVKLGLVD
jgi:hypothetical protein